MLRHRTPARLPHHPRRDAATDQPASLESRSAALQQTIGNRATADLVQRLAGDDRAEGARRVGVSRSAADQLALRGAVGPGAENDPSDVATVRARLDELGFDTGAWLGAEPSEFDDGLARAIEQFQQREVRGSRDGTVTPGGATHSALGIGRQAGAGQLDDELDTAVETSSHAAVERIRTRVAEAEALHAACETEWNQEQGGPRDDLVALLGEIRADVDALADLDLPVEELESVTAWAHRRLNRVSPYYLQGTNADFLETRDSTRTCNLTCLAMTLEALGITAAAYSGDRSKLDEVRGHPGEAGHYDYEAVFDRAKDVTAPDDLNALRLPDFLQLVFVGRNMENGMALKPAVKKAMGDILDLKKLAAVARAFGVAAYARPVGFPSRETDQRQRHVEAFGGLLDQGKQVIAGVGGHFVKIENIEDDGLVINDPGTSKRSDEMIPWADTAGFVKSLMIVG